MSKLAALAITNDVPLLHIGGSIDPILGRFTLPIEKGSIHNLADR